MEVEVREEIQESQLVNQTSQTSISEGPVIIVRAEEVLLVVLVLILWVAAIALFFNRWGKIRMLEPYQPKFQQNHHRPSCPLVPLSPPPHVTAQQRMSFSKYNVNCFGDYSALPSPNISRRPRLNSVFVGSTSASFVGPPRRAKSAFDIQHLLLVNEKRPSITIERPHMYAKRLSVSPDKPLRYQQQQQHFRNRRSSCFDHHKPKVFQTPTISFESAKGPIISTANRPKYSRSFEQPQCKDKASPLPRMATSLEVSACSFITPDRRLSIPEEEAPVVAARNSQVIITFDEADVSANAPLLERLKSSDV